MGRRRRAACTDHGGPGASRGFGNGLESLESRNLLATLAPDQFEANDTISSASALALDDARVLVDLTLHDVEEGPADVDYYRIPPSLAAVSRLRAVTDDPAGDLRLQVVDRDGETLADADQVGDSAAVAIPVVPGGEYWIRVSSRSDRAQEYSLELATSVIHEPQGVHLATASDTGVSNQDGITGQATPTFLIDVDLQQLQGLQLLSSEQARSESDSGAAILVQITQSQSGTVLTGYADRRTPEESLYRFVAPELEGGSYLVSAAVQLFDPSVERLDGTIQPRPLLGRSAMSEGLALQIDVEPPTVTSPRILTSSDSGGSQFDQTTHIREPAFFGVADANVLVRVLANGLPVGETKAGADGRWEITVEPLIDGVYAMTTTAEDLAGNVGENANVEFIEVDATPPNTPFLDLSPGSDTGVSDSDNITGDTTLTFAMTTTDPNAQDHLRPHHLLYRLYARSADGAETLVYQSSDDDAIASEHLLDGYTDLTRLQTTLPELPVGEYNFKLEVEDLAGNISDDFLLPIRIDSALPGGATIDLLADSDTGLHDDDKVTRFHRPTLTGLGSSSGVVTLYHGDRVVGRGVVGSDATDGELGNGLGVWEITTASLDDGIYELSALVESHVGAVRSDALTIEIDSQPPNTPLLDLVPESDSGVEASDNHTRVARPELHFSTHDAGEHGSPFNLIFRLYRRSAAGAEELIYDSAVDDGLTDALRRDGLTSLTHLTRMVPDELSDGVHNLKLEVEDRAGNLSEDTLLNVSIDTVLETLAGEVAIDLLDANDTGMSDRDNVTSKDVLAFTGFAEVGAVVTILEKGKAIGTGWVGSDDTDFSPGDGLGAWNVTLDPLSDGVYSFIAHVEDRAGNLMRSEPLQVEIDRTPPNTPLLDLLNDTGRSSHDNITQVSSLELNMTTHDPVPPGGHVSAFNYKYRIYARPEGGEEYLLYNSVVDLEIPPEFLSTGFTSLPQITKTLEPLPDGYHNLKLEVEDRAGNISHDFLLDVQIDSLLEAPSLRLLPSSDTGVSSEDFVTNLQQPTFAGTAEPGATVRLMANGVLVGVAQVQSDLSDGLPDNAMGAWEVATEPLDDGVYAVSAEVEDTAGNVQSTAALEIEIDTVSPNTPHLDLLEADDSGRHDDDNITNAEAPRFSATSHDPRPTDSLIGDGQNLRYRLYLRPESGTETLLFDSATVDMVEGLGDARIETPGFALAEGLHNLKLEVEDRAGNISHDFLSDVLVDRTAALGTVELDGEANAGAGCLDGPLSEGLISTATPTLQGTAEANSIVSVFFNDELIGSTVAMPFDGDDAYPTARWELKLTEPVDDDDYQITVTFEDPAGNRSNANADGTSLDVVVDSVGPRIENVTRFDDVFTSLFAPKPASGPDPLIDRIVIHFADGQAPSDGRAHPAVAPQLALEEGNYSLVGDANGAVPITSVEIVGEHEGPGVVTTAVALQLGVPLPDDRYTLTVSARIGDAAGNALDGESGAAAPFEGNDGRTPTDPIFPTGDGQCGGDFVGRFTVDSRPEIGVWSAGSVYVDTNGNFVFDQANRDFVNRDIGYTFGFSSDDVFAGNFAGLEAAADGYDKLAAYGHVGGWPGGGYRWLIDIDNDGRAELNIPEPSNVNGLPVAGEFDGEASNGDEVALFTGSHWHFDTNHDYQVDTGLPSELRGYPVIGDFDGDGWDDLGTWSDDVFMLDLSSGELRGWDGVVDARFRFGFLGVRERPVAADMDQDGYDDLGLWVPDRGGITVREASEWYWLNSGGRSLLERTEDALDVVGGVAQELRFTPRPFGDDLFAQFGDEFAIPIVGNFDPPTFSSPGEMPRLYTNPVLAWDVTGDGLVTPRDALVTINHINTFGSSPVGDLHETAPFLDTNHDGHVSPMDVLGIVNFLNATNAARQTQSALARDELFAWVAREGDDEGFEWPDRDSHESAAKNRSPG